MVKGRKVSRASIFVHCTYSVHCCTVSEQSKHCCMLIPVVRANKHAYPYNHTDCTSWRLRKPRWKEKIQKWQRRHSNSSLSLSCDCGFYLAVETAIFFKQSDSCFLFSLFLCCWLGNLQRYPVVFRLLFLIDTTLPFEDEKTDWEFKTTIRERNEALPFLLRINF